MKTVTDVGNPNVKYNYAVITTEIENAKPEIINKRLIDVPHIGINGGFFEGSYTSPPTSLKSISFWKGDTKQYQYNGTSSNQISRKTFISYWQDGRYRADYRYVTHISHLGRAEQKDFYSVFRITLKPTPKAMVSFFTIVGRSLSH